MDQSTAFRAERDGEVHRAPLVRPKEPPVGSTSSAAIDGLPFPARKAGDSRSVSRVSRGQCLAAALK